MHEIWSVNSQESYYNCCHQMSDFKAKMHQIRFWLGLCPRPHWGSLHRSPDPLAGFKGLLRGERGGDGKGKGGKGKKGDGNGGERKEGEGKERKLGSRREGRVKTCCPITNKLSPPMILTVVRIAVDSCNQCFFCKTIFSGTHILIFDWRPQYSTSLRQ